MPTIEFYDHEGLGGSLAKVGSINFETWTSAAHFAENYRKVVPCKTYWGDYLSKIIKIEIIGSGRSR